MPAVSQRALSIVVAALADRDPNSAEGWAVARIRAAIQPTAKRSERQRKRRAAKTDKKAQRAIDTSRLRARVVERAEGRCEMQMQAGVAGQVRCGLAGTEMHHVYGRSRMPQHDDNCLLLCSAHHRLLTLNLPSAALCWTQVVETLQRLGLPTLAARNRLAWVTVREQQESNARAKR